MANAIYCDIGPYVLSGNGTENYPYNDWQVQDYIGNSIASGDELNIRGFNLSGWGLLESNDIGSNGEVTLKAWDLSAYGPWVLNSYTYYNFVGSNSTWNIEDALYESLEISDDYGSDLNVKFKNCILKNPVIDPGGNLLEFKGCTLDGFIDLWEYDGPDNNRSAFFYDCAFHKAVIYDNQDSYEFSPFPVISLEGCTISGDILASAFSATVFSADCQENWSPSASIPDLSACSTENMHYGNFAGGIHPWLNADTRYTDSWYPRGFTRGMFGELRRGAGCFYFDPIVHIDLSRVVSGGGSPDNPLNPDQYQNSDGVTGYFAGEYEFIKFKGSGHYDGYGSPIFIPGRYAVDSAPIKTTVEAWDKSAYGPWRISASEGYSIAPDTMQDGCLFGDTVSVEYIDKSVSWYGMLFKSDGNLTLTGLSAAARGCTFYTPNSLRFAGSLASENNVEFDDCVFVCDSFDNIDSSNIETYLNGCVTCAAEVDLSAGPTNSVNVSEVGTNQYGWSPKPVSDWPTYGSPQESFAFSSIGQGIAISGTGNWSASS